MTRLNRGLQEQIVAAIRAGAFPHVAAQAFGVSRQTFEKWRRLGRSNEGDTEFVSFASAVSEAIAQARLRAEMDVFTEQPRIWLQHGPGRDANECAGWTVAIKPITRSRTERNPLMNREMATIAGQLFEALAPFPEAGESVRQVFPFDDFGFQRRNDRE
jgi:transposase-like protein